MDIQKLLKPRFELIADYPGNSQPIGNVTIEDATASYFRKFHANFRELFWWEKRTVEQMPKYLKVQNNGKIGEVKEYRWWGENCQVEFVGGRTRNLNLTWTPVEEKEYLLTLAQLETANR